MFRDEDLGQRVRPVEASGQPALPASTSVVDPDGVQVGARREQRLAENLYPEWMERDAWSSGECL